MSNHANLSPSKRHRWGICPGSLREEAKYPEQSAGPAAIDGTHSHTLLEYCIKSKLIGTMHQIGHTMKDHEGEFTVDQDRAQRVNSAVEYIRQRVAENGGLCDVISEENVNPEHLLGRSDMSGTVDCQIWGPEIYELIDYKDGMGIVEAKDNAQLEQYAYGVLSKFKLQPGEAYPFSTIRMTIIQPKLALKGMKPIVSHDVSVQELVNKITEVRNQADATDDPNAPLVPGEKQCKFCRAKGSCSALASNVMEGVGIMFQPVNNDSAAPHLITQPAMSQQLDLAQQSANKNPSEMSDEQLRQVLEAAPLMRQFIEGVEAEAQRRLEAGIPVPGFKLVRGRGSRSWTLPEEQMAEKLTKMGIPKGAIHVTKLVSPAQAEKLTWEKKNGERVQLSERQLKKLNEEYVSMNSGKLTIAPESDNREAVITNAAPMFAAIPETPATESLPAWLM